jgi:hypothetical protein
VFGDGDGMSDSIALVRFPDGEIRCAYYFGSAPAVVPLLFPSDSAGSLLDAGMGPLIEQLSELGQPAEAGDLEPVQIWSSHGSTEWWHGSASRATSYLGDGSDPYGTTSAMEATPTLRRPGTSTPGRPSGFPRRGGERCSTTGDVRVSARARGRQLPFVLQCHGSDGRL